MEGNSFYDSSSIAASCKREQLMTEAKEYNLRHQIALNQKPLKRGKTHRTSETPVYNPQTQEKPVTGNI